MNFIWLIFAHFIGDFALQSDWISLNKGKYWYLMVAHCVIWTACVCVALEYMGILLLWKAVLLCVGHVACDVWKCNSTKDFPTWHFYVDQMFHILQVIIMGVV